jgi:hypothetical protein
MFELGHMIHVDQVESGCHRAKCPLCDVVLERITEHGVMQAICEHMNERHEEEGQLGRVGHA